VSFDFIKSDALRRYWFKQFIDEIFEEWFLSDFRFSFEDAPIHIELLVDDQSDEKQGKILNIVFRK